MKSRKSYINALEKRIANIPSKYSECIEIKEAKDHLDNARTGNRKSEYHWTEAVEEARSLISYVEGSR